MITPSFSSTATERVLPRLTLDFTKGSLDPRVAVTRALNTATAVNSSGFVAGVNADLPRFDYNPISLACNGLLIEESRQNLLSYSEDFSQAAWGKFGASISSDVENSPANTLTGDKLVEDSSNGLHRTLRDITTSTSVAYSCTIFAKPAGRNVITLIVKEPVSSSGAYARFNVSTGVITTGATTTVSGTNASASITPYANGWYRCNLTVTPNGGGILVRTEIQLNDGSADSYQGNGTSGAFLWGCQLEQGAFATSYIPTTTTSLTRNADAVTMTGTNFSSWWQSTTGGIVARAFPFTISGIRPAVQFDDGTANEIIALRGNAANPELYIVDGGSPQAQIDAGTLTANTSYNLGSAWNTDNCAAAINGGSSVTDGTATMPTVTQARIGSDGTNYLNGYMQMIRYWPQRLINGEVQAFSK